MTISLNARLAEQVYFYQATGIGDWTSAGWVSMRKYRRLAIIADVTTTGAATGGVVTLNQATAVAGTGAKALAFTRMLANTDYAAAATMVETAVVANTFTIPGTTTKRLRYIIEIDSDALDWANGFHAVKLVSTALVNATGSIMYALWGAKYSGADPTVDI